MSDVHFHLLLNHVPVLGTLFGVLILAAGMAYKSDALKRAGLVTFIVVAIMTIPTFRTGEPAEEAVEHLPGVSEAMIEEHEEAAETASYVAYAVGLLAAVSLFGSLKQRSFANMLMIATLLGGVAVFGMMANVGNLGGKIRHTEIMQGAAANGQETSGEQGEHEEEHEEED